MEFLCLSSLGVSDSACMIQVPPRPLLSCGSAIPSVLSHTASGRGKGRGDRELEDTHTTSAHIPLSECSHIGIITRCKEEAGKCSLFSVRLKVRRFTSIRERGTGYEGQPVVSATDKKICRHQQSP